LILGGTNTKKANWAEVKILLPFGMLGACVGAYGLLKLPTTPVLLTLGAFTMFFGFRNIYGLQPVGRLSRAWAIPAGLAGGSAGALFGAGSPPYIMYLTRRLLDKGAVRATFSWLIAIDGGFRLGLFLLAGLLLDPKLQTAYALGLVPMAIGLYSGNKVHLDKYDFLYTNHFFTPERDRLGYKVIARPAGPGIRSQIVVPIDSPIQSLEDLNGKDVAFVTPDGFTGYWLPMDALLRAKVNIKVVFTGNQEASSAQLKVNKVAAAGVNSSVMARYGRRESFEYRALWTSEIYQDLCIMAN